MKPAGPAPVLSDRPRCTKPFVAPKRVLRPGATVRERPRGRLVGLLASNHDPRNVFSFANRRICMIQWVGSNRKKVAAG